MEVPELDLVIEPSRLNLPDHIGPLHQRPSGLDPAAGWQEPASGGMEFEWPRGWFAGFGLAKNPRMHSIFAFPEISKLKPRNMALIRDVIEDLRTHLGQTRVPSP